MVAVLDCQSCRALTTSARFRYVCERLVCDSCGAENPQTRVRSVQARDIFVHFTTGAGCSVQAMDLNLDRVLGPRVAVTSPETLRRLPGCETKVPHLADPIITTLFDRFAQAGKGLRWVLIGMQELRDSFRDDVERQRFFAWFTRMRQVEELYCRTLYLFLVATDAEIPHILSGDPPNSFSGIYRRVNAEILEGRGERSKRVRALGLSG
jgi:hypothetical protein